jgi:Raf kinase inhibitor-like YbhB/YbcL family protein
LACALALVVAACADDAVESTVADPTPVPLVPSTTNAEVAMRLSSSAFGHEDDIPRRFTCDGDDVSPPLTVSDAPAGAAALVLVMDDPDAPGGTWDHWVAYDIPVTAQIPEGVASLGTAGTNSWGRTGYGGPCPPSGTHRYFFVVYAVDATIGLPAGADKGEVLDAISGHVLAEAALMGRYAR